jgi:thioredoxin reductase
MSGRADVVVIGAGPQGLAVAAHLRHAGLETRVFGEPMGFWKHHMPERMCLRSLPRASSISDPTSRCHFTRFVALRGRPALPTPIQHFIEYGTWFQQELLPDTDRRKVSLLEPRGDGFLLTLDDGEVLEARRVVVAAGIDRFASRPPQFRSVPESLASHTFAHRDFARFAGKRVAVVGGGQSALESAALLRESEADVQVLVRANRVRWLSELPPNGQPERSRRVADRLAPPTGVGPPGLNWIVGVPELYRSLPRRLRQYVGWRAIPPAGADWIRPRLKDVPIQVGREVSRVEPVDGRARLVLNDASAMTVDHVILGSGYAPDISRYEFLSAGLIRGVDRVDGYPELGPGFESSIPGLHFVGAIAAHSFGPIMRFVVGSAYTGREVARFVTDRPPALLDRAW